MLRFTNFNISTKLIVIVLGLMLALVGVNYVFIMSEFRDVAFHELEHRASAFTAVADEAKNHTSQLHADGTFNTGVMIEELKAHVAKGGDFHDTRMFNTIPVVAGWKAAEAAAEREQIDFRIYAFDARNRDNEPEQGSFEERMLRDLESQVAAGGEDSMGRENGATNELVYMRAIELDASCMLCHGDPAVHDEKDAKGQFDGKDVLGFKMESWKPGDMHGAYTVKMPLAAVDADVASFFQKGMMVTVPLLVGIAILLIVLMRRMLSRPVSAMVSTMRDIITSHDLTKRTGINSQNEVGQISRWFDELVGSLQQIIASVSGSARQVAAAATQIAATSEEMAAGLTAQERQASQVSAAVEEMSASITEVAQQSQQASKSAGDSQIEAGKGGEIVSSTVQEIHRIAQDVKASSEKIAELGAKGEKIGTIIDVINDIADQTNLLALNAAIEAARAGEQGRGFAVVADEVRRLAERTSQATEEVASSIREIQSDTRTAIERIEVGAKRVAQGVELANTAGTALTNIVKTSQSVTTMVQSIAAAAEQQSSASGVIAKSVEEINAVTRESAAGAGQAAQASMELSKQAESLQQIVQRFKV